MLAKFRYRKSPTGWGFLTHPKWTGQWHCAAAGLGQGGVALGAGTECRVATLALDFAQPATHARRTEEREAEAREREAARRRDGTASRLTEDLEADRSQPEAVTADARLREPEIEVAVFHRSGERIDGTEVGGEVQHDRHRRQVVGQVDEVVVRRAARVRTLEAGRPGLPERAHAKRAARSRPVEVQGHEQAGDRAGEGREVEAVAEATGRAVAHSHEVGREDIGSARVHSAGGRAVLVVEREHGCGLGRAETQHERQDGCVEAAQNHLHGKNSCCIGLKGLPLQIRHNL